MAEIYTHIDNADLGSNCDGPRCKVYPCLSVYKQLVYFPVGGSDDIICLAPGSCNNPTRGLLTSRWKAFHNWAKQLVLGHITAH